MSKRAIHLYPWDGGTEADTDMPDHVYCGTDGNMTDDQLTNDWQHVTCKRCLKIHEREKAFRAAEDRDQKVKLFDEAQSITVGLGHLNISTAIKAMIAENKRLAIREDVLENLCDARFRINLDLEAERDKLKAQLDDPDYPPKYARRLIAELKAEVVRLKKMRALDKELNLERELMGERDQALAEVEALRSQVATLQSDANSWQSGYDKGRSMGTKTALDEREQLRKDKDRLDALETNFWDVRHISTQVGQEGDTSESIEIVGSWMDAPRERVIGENYSENLRAAIDQAMKAPAYPPARPEYEIPDFGGGSGNKARRRAGELGIDYDAAMGKEASHGG